MKRLLTALSVITIVLAFTVSAIAHCEVPCGIYDDEARIKQLAEHITTIEKSMNKIEELSSAPGRNANQIVRWIMNKEEHAEALQEIVWQYFMTQRVKPANPSERYEHDKYLEKLELLHLMLYHAMKSKQTTDLTHVRSLKALLEDFDRIYFARETQQQQQEEERPQSIFEQLERRLGN